MNEQIRKITGQVLDELVPETWTSLGYDKIKEIQYRTAELIVRECTKVALYGDEYDQARANIHQHFGVES